MKSVLELAVMFGILGLTLFLAAGCGTVTTGCHLSVGLRNEIACGLDLMREPTPTEAP